MDDWTKPRISSRARPQPGRIVTTERPLLTSRQRNVLELMANGYTNEEIALELGVSIETVKSHVKKMLARMNARNRCHLVTVGFLTGLLSITSSMRRYAHSPASLYESESEQSS